MVLEWNDNSPFPAVDVSHEFPMHEYRLAEVNTYSVVITSEFGWYA